MLRRFVHAYAANPLRPKEHFVRNWYGGSTRGATFDACSKKRRRSMNHICGHHCTWQAYLAPNCDMAPHARAFYQLWRSLDPRNTSQHTVLITWRSRDSHCVEAACRDHVSAMERAVKGGPTSPIDQDPRKHHVKLAQEQKRCIWK